MIESQVAEVLTRVMKQLNAATAELQKRGEILAAVARSILFALLLVLVQIRLSALAL